MPIVVKKVFDEVLLLPADARVRLVEQLLTSLNLPTQPEVDQLCKSKRGRFYLFQILIRAIPRTTFKSYYYIIMENRTVPFCFRVVYRQRLLVVAYAERGTRTRLVSAREATRKERRQFEEGKS